MKFLRETERVLQQVEDTTGTPVEVVENANLSQIATMPRARGSASSHVLTVNPTYGQPDYFVVYQCGFVLRHFDLPMSERKDFAGTPVGKEEVERLVRRNGQTANLPAQTQRQLAEQLVGGLMTQLRSYPIGMRIDTWIHKEFPALADLQREGVARQQEDNRKALSPDIKAFAPKPVFEANATMNASYAVFADRLFGKAGYAIPYRSAGLEKLGRTLLDTLESLPDDPAHDVALVDAWAGQLGLADWYQWVPAQP